MTIDAAQDALIKLAAEMALWKNHDHPDDWPWSGRESQKLARAAEASHSRALDQCRDWARRVRQVAEDIGSSEK